LWEGKQYNIVGCFLESLDNLLLILCLVVADTLQDDLGPFEVDSEPLQLGVAVDKLALEAQLAGHDLIHWCLLVLGFQVFFQARHKFECA
jgi:hypothetical protein